MKGNVIQMNTLHLNSVRLNGIGKVQSVSLKGGSTEEPIYPPVEPPVEPTPTYTLSASVTNGKVSATLNGSAVNLPFTANEGDTIVLSVTPNDGYAFGGWADGNTDNPRSITMTADVVLSAECVEVVQPPVGNYIQFEDKAVEAICVANWSSDGIGLTMEDAAKVTDLGAKFNSNTEITSFDELRYFTGLTYISGGALASSAFRNCVNLKKIVIPRNVTNVKDYAMDGCSSLEDVIFEDADKITTIGTYAFRSTKVTGELSFPNLETIYEGAYVATKVKKLVNLGKITSLKGGGLYTGIINNNSEVEFVDIPQSVTSIDAYYFARCYNLATIICRPTTPPSLGANFLYNVSWQTQTTIYVPDASLEAYKTAVNWSAYADRIHPLSEIEGDNGVIKYDGLVGAYTFKGRSNEDADYDLVQDRSGNGNVMTLTATFGVKDSVTGDIVGYNNDLLYLINGFGKMTIPQLAETNTISVIAKRELYSTDGVGSYSAFFGVENPSYTNAVYMDYVEGGFISRQTKGSYRGRDDTKIVWMTPSYMNGHRWTDEPEQQMSGICYLGKLRGNVSFYARVKVECLYVFNRELSPSEVESFIKEHIDADYVLPTIEQ